jgi:putrescine aminotransferase
MTVEARQTSALKSLARARVRHAATDFGQLDDVSPNTYPHMIVRGEGQYLYDDQGRKLLDGGVHLGACQVGHGRAEIARAIADQAGRLEFIALDSGHSHPPVAELADALARVVPVEDAFFIFSSSGSEANETAVKLARLYHARRGEPERVKIVARQGSYHGATAGALALGGVAALRDPFAPLMPGVVRVPQPVPGHCDRCSDTCTLGCADELERAIEQEGASTIAAFIGEPVTIPERIGVPDAAYWRRVREICDAHGILLIVDEVVTGFGRIGRLFGSERFGIRGDMLTLAKGLTSGYVPMGATVVSGAVRDVLGSPPVPHINTYAGHPVACAAALASLRIVQEERLPERAAALESLVQQEIGGLTATRPGARGAACGLLASVELDWRARAPEELPRALLAIRDACYRQGVIIRTVRTASGGLTILFYPPLVATKEDVRLAFDAISRALEAIDPA